MKFFDFAYQNVGQLDRSRALITQKSPSTLVVDMDWHASHVARLIDLNQPRMVFVVDPAEHLRGVVAPSHARTVFSQKYGLTEPRWFDVMQQFQLRRLPLTGFDWANAEPTMLWCERGSHLTDRLPCPDHP